MYLEYYSIKRFFFCHFLKNFRIFLILMLFVSFGGKTMVKLCFNKTHFLKGIGGYLIKIGCGEWI